MMKKIKRIAALFLVSLLVLSFAGCGEATPTPSAENTESPSTSASNTPENTPDNTPDSGEDVIYELPVGAESEYALYTVIIDYLNNGFHYDDLNDVYDPILAAIAIYTRPSDFFTDVTYDELCALLVKLRQTWSTI